MCVCVCVCAEEGLQLPVVKAGGLVENDTIVPDTMRADEDQSGNAAAAASTSSKSHKKSKRKNASRFGIGSCKQS